MDLQTAGSIVGLIVVAVGALKWLLDSRSGALQKSVLLEARQNSHEILCEQRHSMIQRQYTEIKQTGDQRHQENREDLREIKDAVTEIAKNTRYSQQH